VPCPNLYCGSICIVFVKTWRYSEGFIDGVHFQLLDIFRSPSSYEYKQGFELLPSYSSYGRTFEGADRMTCVSLKVPKQKGPNSPDILLVEATPISKPDMLED
jgi:hypothetical protein